MNDKIRIMIIDDIKETRKNISRLISFERDLIVVGEAPDAEQGIELAKELKPDIILIDINLPGMDGLKATEILNKELPTTSIIIISVQEEHYYMHQAIAAGAKEFLMKPFTRDELMEAIRHVFSFDERFKSHQAVEELKDKKSEVITIFSGKGGVGKTTITVNLAVALAKLTKEKVVILDLDLQFGDVSLMMNLHNNLTITDLIHQIGNIDSEELEHYLLAHKSGVKILAAPQRPEEAKLITRTHISKIIKLLQENYRYILIDTEPAFHENNLVAFNFSDKILMISVLELAAIKNIHHSIQIMDKLGYLKEKIYLILNRCDMKFGLNIRDVEKTLDLPIKIHIPNNWSTTVRAFNSGKPFVISNPKASITFSIHELAKLIEPNIKLEKMPGIFDKFKMWFSEKSS